MASWPDLVIIYKKKKKKKETTCRIVDGVELKESEKKDRYLNLAREIKKLWNMKVKVSPIVIGVFDTVIKELVQGLKDWEIRDRVETIKTTA